MTKAIYGYMWMNENGANSAKNALKVHYGLPKTPESITKEWVSVESGEWKENSKTVYYIIYDDTLQQILGDPETFYIITNEEV